MASSCGSWKTTTTRRASRSASKSSWPAAHRAGWLVRTIWPSIISAICGSPRTSPAGASRQVENLQPRFAAARLRQSYSALAAQDVWGLLHCLMRIFIVSSQALHDGHLPNRWPAHHGSLTALRAVVGQVANLTREKQDV